MWGPSRAGSVQAGRAETDKVTVGYGAHPTVSQSDGQSDHLRGQEKNCGERLAVGYRYLNAFTVADAYLMVTVNEILYKMGSANHISLYDANSGYWQIPVAQEDQWKTAFVKNGGLYEWTRKKSG